MNIREQITSPELEDKGTWVDAPEFGEGTRFRLASINGKGYQTAYQKGFADLRSRKKKATREDTQEVLRTIYSRHIVVGWEGLSDGEKDFAYTPENAKFILDSCPSVRDWIFNQAATNENFRAEQVEEAKATLGESSSGTSDTPKTNTSS